MSVLKPLIVGNWKMNPATINDAKKLFLEIRKGVQKYTPTVEVAIAAPYPFLSELNKLAPARKITLAAQDSAAHVAGTYTGEVALPMLASVGVGTVIIGHSERRQLGEDERTIAAKLTLALQSGFTAVLCVGERERDTHGQYFTVVEKQLTTALETIPHNKIKQLTIAYEPVWAISTGDGKGKTATPEDAEEMRLFIQKVLADRVGRPALKKVRILYGGSVNASNIGAFVQETHMNGYLPGGASLKPTEFITIVHTVATHVKKTT